jgi:nicotinamide-nucleotide amidase
VAGSSDWFERGFVTYSNEAKTELLGVDAGADAAHGAVSEPVARAMAEGALQRAPVQLAVAVTGIAGPGRRGAGQAGGHGVAGLGHAATVQAERLQLAGDRDAVRGATVRGAARCCCGRARLPDDSRPGSSADAMKQSAIAAAVRQLRLAGEASRLAQALAAACPRRTGWDDAEAARAGRSGRRGGQPAARAACRACRRCA